MSEPSLDDLTRRELEVLYWLANGKSAWDTGVILQCSEATVKKHRCHIYQTLCVNGAVSAALFYWQARGFLKIPARLSVNHSEPI